MANLRDSREKFVVIYVKFFRHYRTKKLVFPKPPHKFIRLKIRADRYAAYQARKAAQQQGAATSTR